MKHPHGLMIELNTNWSLLQCSSLSCAWEPLVDTVSLYESAKLVVADTGGSNQLVLPILYFANDTYRC